MPPPAIHMRKRVDVVVAAAVLAVFAHRRAAEFAAPDDERVVEQAALFEVDDQRRPGLIDFAADFFRNRLRDSGPGRRGWSQSV